MTGGERAFFQPRVFIPFAVITLIWSSTWLVITGQLGAVPPTWSVAYRFAIGSATMFVFAALSGESLRIGRHGHWLAFAFGIPQFCLNYNSVYFAEQYVTSGLVAVVFALLLVPNSLLAWFFLGHRVSRRFVLGSLVAVAGVVLLFVQELGSSRAPPHNVLIGVGLAVLGVLSASVANIIQASEPLRVRSLPAMIAWGMAYGTAINAAVSMLFFGPPVFVPSAAYVAGLLYLGVIASALAFSLYFAVMREIGPGPAAYSSLIIPIIAMLLSTAFEGYRWSWLAVAGGALTLVGLFIALRARRSEDEQTRAT